MNGKTWTDRVSMGTYSKTKRDGEKGKNDSKMIKKETWMCNNWCVHLLKLRHFHPDSDRPWFSSRVIDFFFIHSYFNHHDSLGSCHHFIWKSFVRFAYAFFYSISSHSAMHQWFDSIIYAHSIVNWCGGFKWNGAKLFDKVLYSRSQFPGWWWICQLRIHTK